MSPRTLPSVSLLLLAIGVLPAAQTAWDSGNPTADEQYVLELINRARADPFAEGVRLGLTPDIREGLSTGDAAAVGARGPLAMNSKLLQIARVHSQDMWTNNYFSHNSLAGTPSQRMTAAGYIWSSAGENIAVGSNHTAAALEDNLMIDAGITGRGHRTNLLDLGISYREIGIGYYQGASANSSGWRSFLTQDFGTSSTSTSSSSPGPFIVGVIYSDSNSNGFYNIGEGISGVDVIPASGAWKAVTGTAGGYAFPAASSGTLSVTFSGGSLSGTILKTVILGTANRKLDVRGSDPASGTGTITPAAPAVDSLTSATPTLSGSTQAGASIVIYDSASPVGTATADGSGAWSWTSPTLAAGSHVFTWTASNLSGTSGASPSRTVTVSGSGGSTGTGSGSAAAGGGCGAGGAGLLLALGLGLLTLRRAGLQAGIASGPKGPRA